MNVTSPIEAAFASAIATFAGSAPMRMLAEGRITLEHYKAVLREMYHYAKEDPQIQALASVYFRGADRSSVKLFLKHATAEIGHDLMALDDLRILGEDISAIPRTLPLPSTIALTAFPFYQVQYHNPVGYLGYLYFLEHMPTQAGQGYMAALEHAGVPKSAMTFLAEHVSVDVGHNKLMLEYIRRLVRTPEDVSAVCYAISVTGHLYAAMLEGALQSAGRAPLGVNHEEANRWVGELVDAAA